MHGVNVNQALVDLCKSQNIKKVSDCGLSRHRKLQRRACNLCIYCMQSYAVRNEKAFVRLQPNRLQIGL